MACLLDKSKVFSISSEMDSFLQEEKMKIAVINEILKMIFFVCIMYNFVDRHIENRKVYSRLKILYCFILLNLLFG
jgi:hypothetical protein